MKALCEFGKNFITKREIKSWYKKLLKEKGGQQTIRLILNYEACSPNDLAMAYIGKEDNSFITIDIKQLLKIGCDRDEIKFIIAHELYNFKSLEERTQSRLIKAYGSDFERQVNLGLGFGTI